MPSTPAHDRTGAPAASRHTTSTVSRVGHLAAAGGNIVLLWVTHQLLEWGWPAFLTGEFTAVLGLVTAAFVANVLAECTLAAYDHDRLRALAELVSTGFGLAVGLRLLEVFPFDFSDYATDWSGVAHAALILLIAVTGIAMVTNLVTFVAGPFDD